MKYVRLKLLELAGSQASWKTLDTYLAIAPRSGDVIDMDGARWRVRAVTLVVNPAFREPAIIAECVERA